ncbi:MAG: tRNA preQ1(34) S-adenosylmethionine ribosyltransferase-isomerase QueA [Acidobacteria bacterium]|nr:tRNA preQ1(34) S-adenosylmethionine ribosyltransferase-isomerase QueA [Acidobacteriota bacterium]
MLTADFDYELPAGLIAQQAVARGDSRLLVVDAEGGERHRGVADLPGILRPGDLLVVNNTRVIPARLFARRATGGRVEVLLVERQAPAEWTALLKPGRRARPGTRLELDDSLTLEVLAKLDDGRYRLRFSEPIEPHLERLGHVPLPPYIKRSDDAADRERYQTVYASVSGAIAAPTAGLHFTPELLAALRGRGIGVAEITLHIGIGTFKPITAALVHEHRMEAERYDIPTAVAATIEAVRAARGRVVAVGTSVVRALESACDEHGALRSGSSSTALFITPGYRFRLVDILLTNFHLPKSTLLMLVSAFAGRERILTAYAEAIHQRYRFYSYGDAMLLGKSL